MNSEIVGVRVQVDRTYRLGVEVFLENAKSPTVCRDDRRGGGGACKGGQSFLIGFS